MVDPHVQKLLPNKLINKSTKLGGMPSCWNHIPLWAYQLHLAWLLNTNDGGNMAPQNKMSVKFYWTAQHYNPEESTLQSLLWEAQFQYFLLCFSNKILCAFLLSLIQTTCPDNLNLQQFAILSVLDAEYHKFPYCTICRKVANEKSATLHKTILVCTFSFITTNLILT